MFIKYADCVKLNIKARLSAQDTVTCSCTTFSPLVLCSLPLTLRWQHTVDSITKFYKSEISAMTLVQMVNFFSWLVSLQTNN